MNLISQTRKLLDIKALEYNQPEFIKNDPIQIPHLFTKPEDIEISGFLTATIAWGQRVTIINNAKKLINLMDNAPHQFICQFESKDLKRFEHFCHRTFNYDDTLFFMQALQQIYSSKQGLKAIFEESYSKNKSIYRCLTDFRAQFLVSEHLSRSEKHISSVEKGSSAKRLNMFLRWMVRNDGCGVDFGIWKGIPASALYIPLDLHTGNVARKLGLLTRKQNDWQAVEELTNILRTFDPTDPVKYDFALFGMGINENR